MNVNRVAHSRTAATSCLRVVVVARARGTNVSPFVQEQVDALCAIGVDARIAPIRGRGVSAYVQAIPRIQRIAEECSAHLIHAHFGVSALAATRLRGFPVVATFHGSDINRPGVRLISRLAARRAAACIVVSNALSDLCKFSVPPAVIPCGIDLTRFYPEDRSGARARLGFGDEHIILFGASRQRRVKNFALAAAAVRRLSVPARLIELNGCSREEVRMALSAADVLLVTSRTEGSPQVVKEALATGCPIVSTNVGDVQEITAGLPHCYVTAHDAAAIAEKLHLLLGERPRVPRTERIESLGNELIARRVLDVYESVLNSR